MIRDKKICERITSFTMDWISVFKLASLKSNSTYKEFLLLLLDRLVSLPSDGVTRIYVHCIVERYVASERDIINGMLGVVGSSEKIRKVLFVILGLIMDSNYECLLERYYDTTKKDELTVDDMIDYISKSGEGDVSYPLNKKFEFEYDYDNTKVMVDPRKINLWDLRRIREFILSEENFGFLPDDHIREYYHCNKHNKTYWILTLKAQYDYALITSGRNPLIIKRKCCLKDESCDLEIVGYVCYHKRGRGNAMYAPEYDFKSAAQLI